MSLFALEWYRKPAWLIHYNTTIVLRRNLKTVFSLWKRSECFPSTLRRRNHWQQKRLSVPLSVRVNHMIIMTSSLSKSPVFNMYSVHTKTQSRRFQIPRISRAFSKSFVFGGQFLRIAVDGRPNRRNKAAFSNFYGVVRKGALVKGRVALERILFV